MTNRQKYSAPRISRPSGELEQQEVLAIEINEEHNISMKETEENFKAEKTVKDHNRRLHKG